MLSLSCLINVRVAALLLVLSVGGWLAPSCSLAGEAINVGQQTQVLADDYVVESMRGLVRRVNLLAKHPANPVIRPDRPWEEGWAMPLTVFFDADEQLYRMWYRPGYGKFNLGYVTSSDGISWDKPALGLVDYKGSRENNQLALKTGPAWNGVLKDKRDPDPERRYKLFAYNRATNSNGWYLFVSPDGLNWKPHSDKPMLEGLADCHNFMGWDENIQRYVAYVRPDKPVRTIARTTSENLTDWTPIQSVLEPDEDDPPGTQLYGMSVFPDRGVYYGLLWVYHPNSLTIDVQLAFSRDGIAWQRMGRRHPILSYGLPNQFDSHILIAMQPILVGDELKVYYLAQSAPHAVVYPNEAYPPLKAPPPRTEQTWLKDRKGYTGLATTLRDRFVSLDADSKPGEFVTKPFVLKGSQIRLNADAKRGDIKVEVQDADGKPLPGFIAGLTNRINTDSVRQEVSWRGKGELASLKGCTVKLRFQLHYARLYSFEVLP